ncbi:MAG: APC family permease [Firmicutes bacterium]|nr:APC family permease [Bacillota bacterium]
MEGRQELEKSLNMKDVLALAFGTMIGWGWIMLAGSWVANGGIGGAVIAFLLGGVMAIFVGLTYAELTPMLPLSGGELVFSYRAMGYNASWFTGWFITLAYLGVACWEGPALSNAINFLFGGKLPQLGVLYEFQGSQVTGIFLLIGVVGAIVMTIVNYMGAKSAAIFQTFATVLMAIGGIAFFCVAVGTGVPAGEMIGMFTGTKGLVTVILAVPAMFVGFDVIPQAAEEMAIPLGKIGKVMIISICMAAAWYILMIIGVAMSVSGDQVIAFNEDPDAVPVANCFAAVLGSPVWGKVMILAAMCGILSSWNGFVVGSSRVLFSMGRAKMLPPIFGKVHEKYGSPTVAVLLVGILTMLSPLLGKSALVWFVDAAAFGTVVAYFMVSLSFTILRKKEPELERPFRTPAGGLVGVVAVLVALFFLWLYLPLGSPAPLTGVEWGLVGGWTILGIILFIANKASANGKATKEEVEYLMFGDEYKRF